MMGKLLLNLATGCSSGDIRGEDIWTLGDVFHFHGQELHAPDAKH